MALGFCVSVARVIKSAAILLISNPIYLNRITPNEILVSNTKLAQTIFYFVSYSKFITCECARCTKSQLFPWLSSAN